MRRWQILRRGYRGPSRIALLLPGPANGWHLDFWD